MLIFLIYVLSSSFGIILFKLGSKGVNFTISNSDIGLKLSYFSLIGLTLYVVSFLLWMIIISKNDVSKIVPIGLGATNILIMFLSYFLLGETISMVQLIGVLTVIIGVVLMNL